MYDPARALKEVIDKYPLEDAAELGESATRLLIVDTVLSEVLGWSKNGFHPEDPVSDLTMDGVRRTQWLDYHLSDPSTPQRLVVEAKRTGTTFSLRKKPRRDTSLSGLMHNHGQHLREVIEQARKYCVNSGTDAFLVTNGHQWVGSISFAQTVSFDRIQAVVFPSLQDIYDNLGEFLDLFSPAGIRDRHLAQRSTTTIVSVPSFAQKLHGGHRQIKHSEKNYLVAPLQMLMSLCFDDLTSREHDQMLEQCYVTTDASDRGIKHLEAFVGINLPESLGLTSKLDRGDSNVAPFPDPLGVRGGTVLLAGRAGSGKSTFLARTRQRLGSNLADHRHVVLLCDLREETELHARTFHHEQFKANVCKELLQLAEVQFPALSPFRNDNLRQVFHREIKRREDSMEPNLLETEYAAQARDELIKRHLEDPVSHLKAYLGYLGREGYRTTVLLDNVDRGTEEFERVTFQLAANLAHNSRTTVVVALRDTTIERGKRLNFLDVRQSPVVTLTAPPFLEVARRRFEYVTKLLQNDARLWSRFSGSLAGAEWPRVVEFAEILAELLLRPNSPVANIITALAGTNIRRGLGLLAAFSISPWTDLNKMFRAYESRNNANVASAADFLRAIMKRDKHKYIEDDLAEILNLFRADNNRVTSHFLPIRLLQYLEWRSRSGPALDAQLPDVFAVFSGIGYPSSDVTQALNRLGHFSLISSLTRAEPPWDEGDSVRLSAAGAYYLQELVFQREYLFNVADDTTIYDVGTFSRMSKAERNPDEPAILRRLEDKLAIFVEYLVQREREELNRMGTRPSWLSPIAAEVGHRALGGRRN